AAEPLRVLPRRLGIRRHLSADADEDWRRVGKGTRLGTSSTAGRDPGWTLDTDFALRAAAADALRGREHFGDLAASADIHWPRRRFAARREDIYRDAAGLLQIDDGAGFLPVDAEAPEAHSRRDERSPRPHRLDPAREAERLTPR